MANVDTVDWRSQLEQEISLNDKYSQYIRLDDDYDAEDLFKILENIQERTAYASTQPKTSTM
jgi:hypothetical protein